MKVKYILTIILILYNCSLEQETPSNAPTIVSGTVIDTTTGEPIDSVEVELSKKTKFSIFPTFPDYIGPTYSNSSGEFYIKDNYVRKDDDDFLVYELSAGKQGYYYKSFDIEENEVNEFDIALKPHPTELHTSVSGRVLDKVTELPLDSVKVSLLRKTDFTNGIHETIAVAFTNGLGKYIVEDYYIRKQNESFPDYDILWEKEGYESKGWHLVGTNSQEDNYVTYLVPE